MHTGAQISTQGPTLVFINVFTLSPSNGFSNRFFFLEPQWQVKLFYAFQHMQKTNVEWNIFMAIEHDPNDKI